MTITVSIPYWGCPDLVDRAVRSVLAQTVRDISVVVIGDGEEPPLAGLHDGRLEVYTLPANRGTYFAHQLVLHASPRRWFAPVDADDWVEPNHLERLLARGAEAVVPGALWYHDARRGADPVRQGRRAGWHVGLFGTDRLRAIGGYEPDARLSQDLHTLRILALAGPVERIHEPTYHRWKRAGSLTTHPATNLSSEARQRARARNRATLAACRVRRRPDRIRAYRESLVALDLRAELAEHVDRLGARLGQAAAA